MRARDVTSQKRSAYKRAAQLGIPGDGCKVKTRAFVTANFTGLCGTETNTLLTALASAHTKLNCPINATSCVVDYSTTSKPYYSLCPEMCGQLFVIANKQQLVTAAEVNGTNTSYFFSESKQNWNVRVDPLFSLSRESSGEASGFGLERTICVVVDSLAELLILLNFLKYEW
jgi:hypothetical protein